MARGFLLPIVLLLAGASGFGQIIMPGGGGYPGRYPGGGYPGGGYPPGSYPPGSYPQGGGRNPQGGQGQSREPDNKSNNFTGIIRKISDNSLIMEADDKTITTLTTAGSTKYTDTKGKSAKIGDFQPGDHISVSADQDNKSVYHAKKVTLVTEGTADEHAAASQAMDDPTRPITAGSSSSSQSASNGASNGTSNSNDSNRPKLRRAASSSDSDVTSSSSGSSNNSNDDPDRPRLRRASSSSDNSSSSSASSNSASSSSSSSSSSDDDPDRPRFRRAASSPDSSAPAQIDPNSSATIAPRRGSAPAPAASNNSSNSNNSDDSGPPVLRRSRPAGSDAPVVADSRPSLHADDANGVTRAPSLPQVGDSSDGGYATNPRVQRRLPASDDDFIDQARDAAFSFSETLPNYVVKQFTTRYATIAARGGKTSWQALDEVTADVIEEDGTEKYKNILVNGKTPRQDPEKTGSWSKGEFSSLLQDILSPITDADFHGKRATTIVNRAAFRYDFSVTQPNSHWHVESEGQSYMPGYTGAIWIDKENFRVLRIELSAQSMPRGFPLDTVESAVDYDYVFIGEAKYLLPVHSEALSCGRGTSQCSRNVIEFRNYKKFTADTSITFEPDK